MSKLTEILKTLLVPLLHLMDKKADKTALADKADKTELPTKLSEMSGDSTHRTVTDSQINHWNNKSDFNGSYTSLTNKPTIYTDVVRYSVTQSLSDTQKKSARANIGAGTSDFSGSYNDLTDTPTLATVASSGAYNDLSGLPFYDSRGWEAETWISSASKYRVIASTQDTNTGYYSGSTTGASLPLETGAVYRYSTNVSNNVETVARRYKLKTGYQYCDVLGNAQMAVDMGIIDGTYSYGNILPAVDTGEDECYISYDSTAKNEFIAKSRDQFMVLEVPIGELVPMDEKYIPDTIQRVGDAVIIPSSTEGSTKRFSITVDDSGTLTATEVT